MPRRPHPRGTVIAYIWICVILAAFLGALYSQDNDPSTDEGAGAGALVMIVGGALTAVYLAVGKRLNSRATMVAGGADNVEAAPDTRPWLRRNLGPFVAAAAAIVVIVFAPSKDTAAPATEPPPIRSANELAAMIKAAANAASARPISSVDCATSIETVDSRIVSCAVTFDGPACQFWLAGGTLDDPEPVGEPAKGRRGRADDKMAHCE